MNGASRRRRPAPKVLYTRELPGGGFVTIQAAPGEGVSYHGWIAVERRTDRARRDGTEVPVIAEANGETTESVYDALHSIASDNVAVARAIRRWEREHTA